MTEEPGREDLLLSDDERMHALNVVSEHYAAGRLDTTEFYDRSEVIASARTLDVMRGAFRGLPGGVPLEQVDGRLRKIPVGEDNPAAIASRTTSTGADAELSSLRRRGGLIDSLDGVIFGVTLVTFLVLQVVVDWDYAWVVWPSLLITLSLPRMILRFSDADEEIYGELKDAEAKSRKKRLQEATERILELESKNDPGKI
ncbi:protein of unknown function [Rhodococcus maanshanensis]|uniref:DUF1707 domain-containing protein n=2 Tax=Rhodococcus maanshanensis TaxID=183556 RepID=A0A1H7QKJ9_9NOCA|nr:DUF1707 domain-containing protein [Rhodococcus maanshanensis]SEL47787.1 protein of unknown function [Rhodococcus maanshanensis]